MKSSRPGAAAEAASEAVSVRRESNIILVNDIANHHVFRLRDLGGCELLLLLLLLLLGRGYWWLWGWVRGCVVYDVVGLLLLGCARAHGEGCVREPVCE